MQQAPQQTEQKNFTPSQDWKEGMLSRLDQNDEEYWSKFLKKAHWFIGGAGLLFLVQLACFISRQDSGWSLVLQSLRDTFLP